MSSRWTGFFIWALVAAVAAIWTIKIFAATRPVPPGTQAAQVAMATSGPMVRLFGAVVVPTEPEQVEAPDSDRFQLVGVIAPRSGGSGYALVAIDGQPARSWHVGSLVDGETTLLGVARRTADFGPRGGPKAFTLELPEPAAAETGTLPAAVSQPNGPAPTPAPQMAQTAQQMIQNQANQQPGVAMPGAVRGNFPPGGFAGRGGMPIRPGMIPPNVVPPGRTAPTAGQQQVQPNDGTGRSDDE